MTREEEEENVSAFDNLTCLIYKIAFTNKSILVFIFPILNKLTNLGIQHHEVSGFRSQSKCVYFEIHYLNIDISLKDKSDIFSWKNGDILKRKSRFKARQEAVNIDRFFQDILLPYLAIQLDTNPGGYRKSDVENSFENESEGECDSIVVTDRCQDNRSRMGHTNPCSKAKNVGKLLCSVNKYLLQNQRD